MAFHRKWTKKILHVGDSNYICIPMSVIKGIDSDKVDICYNYSRPDTLLIRFKEKDDGDDDIDNK